MNTVTGSKGFGSPGMVVRPPRSRSGSSTRSKPAGGAKIRSGKEIAEKLLGEIPEGACVIAYNSSREVIRSRCIRSSRENARKTSLDWSSATARPILI